jgi:Fic family protein
MAHLHQRFDHYWQAQTVEPLLLIATYTLDFLCIHPFSDGNGRLARLITLLLLYQAGYEVGRYISLENLIEQSRESYYDTLYWSSQGWHEGQHTLIPWWEYFLGLILKAYRDFEQRVGLVAQVPGRKRQQVLAAVARLPQQFQIADVERACPGVSRPTLNRALAQLRDEGKIVCIKAGRDALWQKIDEPE